jgi:hypothetical protein
MRPYVRHRDQGAGSRLLAVALEGARAAGATRIFLETEAPNDAVRRFYRRHGFVVHVARLGGSDQVFEFGEDQLDRIEVRAIGRQNSRCAPLARMALRAACVTWKAGSTSASFRFCSDMPTSDQPRRYAQVATDLLARTTSPFDGLCIPVILSD